MLRTRPVAVALGVFDDLDRRGFRSLVDERPELNLCLAEGPVHTLALALRSTAPTVAVVEGRVASADGWLAVRALRINARHAGVVICSRDSSAAFRDEALAAGAHSCLGAPWCERDIVAAILCAAGGGRYHVPVIDRDAVDECGLTPREHEITELLLEGYTRPQIAAKLTIALETVRSHCRSVLHKVQASDTQELRRRLSPRRVRPPSASIKTPSR